MSQSSREDFDITIIGAGVVGLAIAASLSNHKTFGSSKILVLESKEAFGTGVSSRSSEVIHAGLYYPRNSLKTKMCVRGNRLLYEHCNRFGVPYKKLGKLVVANKDELDDFEALISNAWDNGVTGIKRLSKSELRSIEPSVCAEEVFISRSTGIVDSHSLMKSFLFQLSHHGHTYVERTEAISIEPIGNGFELNLHDCSKKKPEPFCITSRSVINAAGMGAQKLTSQIVGYPAAKIPPQKLAKGCYFGYKKKNPFSHLIYPVTSKNPNSLGIHATIDLGGQLKFGPDIEYVSIESYDVVESKKEIFVQAIKDYFPSIKVEHLTTGYAGIRPKLVSQAGSSADFLIQEESSIQMKGLVQLFGIESPGLTSCIPIGEYVCDLLEKSLEL
jgi:L-2-hydroxyglutarate oxidase LhgO